MPGPLRQRWLRGVGARGAHEHSADADFGKLSTDQKRPPSQPVVCARARGGRTHAAVRHAAPPARLGVAARVVAPRGVHTGASACRAAAPPRRKRAHARRRPGRQLPRRQRLVAQRGGGDEGARGASWLSGWVVPPRSRAPRLPSAAPCELRLRCGASRPPRLGRAAGRSARPATERAHRAALLRPSCWACATEPAPKRLCPPRTTPLGATRTRRTRSGCVPRSANGADTRCPVCAPITATPAPLPRRAPRPAHAPGAAGGSGVRRAAHGQPVQAPAGRRRARQRALR